MMHNAPSTLEQLLVEHALAQVLTRYATACDTRDWALLDQVFTADCTTVYGGSYICQGIDKVRHMISSHLDGCGPTQHLLGNLQIDVSNPQAVRSKIQVRAAHKGLHERSGTRYDAIGFYEDEWLLQPQGWRIHKRSMSLLLEIGDRSVLQPAAKP
ncbi:MAG: nuclear transport factor 2 family protein [Comamonas sp.]